MNGSTSSRTRSTRRRTAPGGSSPSSNSVRTIASTTTASEPGRTKRCSSAALAVSVRRGSTTTIRPPRALRARSRLGKSGTVISEPLDAIGLAPKHQEVGRAVDVGDRQQQLVAVELPGDELVGDLVDRRGAEAVAGAQHLHHRHAVGGRAEGVRVGVAEVDAEASRPCSLTAGPARRRPGRAPRPRRSPPTRRRLRCRRGVRDCAAGRDRRARRRARRPWGRCSRGRAGRRGCRGWR